MEIIPEMLYTCERWMWNKADLGEPLFFYPLLQYSNASFFHVAGMNRVTLKIM